MWFSSGSETLAFATCTRQEAFEMALFGGRIRRRRRPQPRRQRAIGLGGRRPREGDHHRFLTPHGARDGRVLGDRAEGVVMLVVYG
jgi:hypothetical protein